MIDPDIERAQRLANQATHDSVTAERLTENKIGIKRYRLYDNPLYRYLQSDEKPQFLFHSKRHTPTFNGPSAPKEIERSRQFRVLHLITDSRWLMIAGNRSGDQKHELLLNEIGATNHQTGDSITSRLSKNLFAIETEGVHYTIPLSNDYNESDLEDLSRFLRNYYDAIRGGVAIDSDEAGYTIAGSDEIKYDAKDVRSRLDRLPDSTIPEADQLISETDDIEELIPRLDSLIEREEESTQSLN